MGYYMFDWSSLVGRMSMSARTPLTLFKCLI